MHPVQILCSCTLSIALILTSIITISVLPPISWASESVTFQYHGGGCPETWYRASPTCGSNDPNTLETLKQSPIDIDPSQVKAHATGLGPLLVRNYHLRAGKWRLEKTRTGLFLKVDGISPFIEVPTTYMFLQAHLHWGPGVAKVGSEHSVDGHFFPLEVHLVHYNRARDEYAVVAILYEISAPNTHGADNDRLKPIFEVLETETLQQGYNRTGGESTLLLRSVFTLENLFPQLWDSYYRYNGSLTTPPCSENVIWTVLRERSHVSRRQMALLSGVRQCDQVTKICSPRELIGPNRRPTQALNNRPVYLHTSGSRPGGGGHYDLQTILAILTLAYTFGSKLI